MIQASDIMTIDVRTVLPNMPIKDLAAFLIKHNISGVPVVEENGKLFGIVTEQDLIDQKKQLHIPTIIALFEAVIYLESPKKMEGELHKMLGTTVKDICTQDVVTIEEHTSLQEIASIMANKGIHLLPVMQGEKIVGIVGKADVVRAIAQSL